jgi:hypothetical protein
VADGFYVVAVRIEHEGAVIVRVTPVRQLTEEIQLVGIDGI